MDPSWTPAQMQQAQRIVVERFAMNSVARHLASPMTVDEIETTVKRNRFDVGTGRVVDSRDIEPLRAVLPVSTHESTSR
jgi:hypothetical protein